MASDDLRKLEQLSQEMREVAREDARRQRNATSGQQSSSSVTRGTDDKPMGDRADVTSDAGPKDINSGMQAISSRLDTLTRQFDDVSRRPAKDPAAAGLPQADGEVSSMLRDIEQRLDTLNPARVKDSAADRGREPGSLAAGQDNFSLDGAIAEIAARQRVLDAAAAVGLPAEINPPPAEQPIRQAAGPAPSEMSGLQAQLRVLTEEIQALRKNAGFDRVVQELREELVTIAAQIAEAAPRRTLQGLETQVGLIAARLERERDNTGEGPALRNIERQLERLEEKLQQIAPAENLQTLRTEIAELNRRIDGLLSGGQFNESDATALYPIGQAIAELRDIASHAASGDALIALAEEVQAIGDRVDHVIAAAPQRETQTLTLLDQRFQELAAHLDARERTQNAAPAHLAGIMESLAEKLDRVDVATDTAPLLNAIAEKISRITEHVESTETRIGSLSSFEQTARNLLGGIEELRETTLAATRQGLEIAESRERADAGLPDADGLRQQFLRLQESQDESDRRTQDTLEAVHDTLERLVERLAEVETDLHTAPAAAEAHVAPTLQAAPEFGHRPAPLQPAPLQAAPLAPATPAMPLSEGEREPHNFDPPEDHPLEPGSVQRARASMTAAERIAASEAALGPAKPVVESEAKLNFIAAARRAAQAAANMAEPPVRESGEQKASSSFSALAQKLTGRRPMMLGLLLLVSAGAIHLLINGAGPVGRLLQAEEQVVASVATPAAPEALAAPAPAPAASVTASPAATPFPATIGTSPLSSGAPPIEPGPRAPAQISSAASPARGASDSRTTPTVSPLTIASISIPAGGGDLTGSITRPNRVVSPQPTALPSNGGEFPGSISKTLRTAALAGDPAAEYEIALRYAEGRGVAANIEEAGRWFERAANRELAPAQYRLGGLFEKGHGVRKDLDQARRLYRAAADKGHAKAMHNLAVLYAEGLDGKPDFRAAADWFRRAALHGVADSQYNLGILSARGLGTEQNLSESYQWFALAAIQGDQDAGRKRDDVGARLDPEALASAQAAVKAFIPQVQPEGVATVPAPAGGWDAAPAASGRTPHAPVKRARPS